MSAHSSKSNAQSSSQGEKHFLHTLLFKTERGREGGGGLCFLLPRYIFEEFTPIIFSLPVFAHLVPPP